MTPAEAAEQEYRRSEAEGLSSDACWFNAAQAAISAANPSLLRQESIGMLTWTRIASLLRQCRNVPHYGPWPAQHVAAFDAAISLCEKAGEING